MVEVSSFQYTVPRSGKITTITTTTTTTMMMLTMMMMMKNPMKIEWQRIIHYYYFQWNESYTQILSSNCSTNKYCMQIENNDFGRWIVNIFGWKLCWHWIAVPLQVKCISFWLSSNDKCLSQLLKVFSTV